MIDIQINLSESIQGCINAKVIGNKICYQTASGKVKIGEYMVENITTLSNLFFLQPNTYYSKDGNLFLVEKDKLKLIFQNSDSDKVTPIKENIFLSFKRESRKNNIYKLFNSKSEMLWQTSGNIFIEVLGEFIVEKQKFNETEFEVKELKNHHPKWTFKTDVGTRIVNGPYLMGELVVVIIENLAQQRYEASLIDIYSGNQEWQGVVHLRTPKIQKNKLYEFASNTFGKSFLANLDILEKSTEIIPIDFQQRTSGALNSIYDEILFFTYLTNGCGVGAIDLISKEIVSLQALKLNDGIGVDAPLVTSEKIVIKDSQNTIHVFDWNKKQLPSS